jgi:activating signal cointegrator complex subunit 1
MAADYQALGPDPLLAGGGWPPAGDAKEQEFAGLGATAAETDVVDEEMTTATITDVVSIPVTPEAVAEDNGIVTPQEGPHEAIGPSLTLGQRPSSSMTAAVAASGAGADGSPSSQLTLSHAIPFDQLDGSSSSEKRPGSIRSTSSKIANLRATFERNSAISPSEMVAAKRRFPGGEAGKKDLIAEREREYWKEIARLRDERDKEVELRVAFEERCAELGSELASVRKELKEKDQAIKEKKPETSRTPLTNGLSNGVSHNNPAPVQTNGQSFPKGHVVVPEETRLNIPKQRSAELIALEKQVADLKRTISTSTRMDSVVTDSTFAQEMGMLHHELQNWVVNAFRRAKIDAAPSDLCAKLESAADGGPLSTIRPLYEKFEPSAKLAIYQATVAVYVLAIFSAPLLFGLGRNNREQEWQAHIHRVSESLALVLAPAAYNKWRAITLEAVRHTDSLQEAAEITGRAIADTVCKVLGAVSGLEVTESQRVTLNSIIRKTISLSHMFRVQRAQYEFRLPPPESDVKAAAMESVSPEDEEGTGKGRVRCATFPSVTKLGDEFGDNLYLRNIIFRAKVLCYAADHVP